MWGINKVSRERFGELFFDILRSFGVMVDAYFRLDG